MRRKLVLALAVLVMFVSVGFFGFAAEITDQRMNGVHRPKHAPVVSEHAKALIAAEPLVDLHADSLLWGRDLLADNTHGHVDLPKLRAGGFGLQVFDVVTKTPRHMNIEKNDDTTDNVRLLAMAQRYPPAAMTSLLARATYQADRLHAFAAASEGRLRVVRYKEDLDGCFGDGVVCGMLGLEGAHALDGDAANIAALADKGFRFIGLAHFFDNPFAGSAHGVHKGGITKEAGQALLDRIDALSLTVDLAHASEATVNDVLARAKRPVVVSHTGVRGTCDTRRNLSDEQLRKIAAGGGLVGIGFFANAVCGDDHKAIVRAIVHAVNVAGKEHVAFGSDYDGAVNVPFHAGQAGELVQALLDAGLDDATVRGIIGGNARRFLATVLPARP